jgi:hypothetical protein
MVQPTDNMQVYSRYVLIGEYGAAFTVVAGDDEYSMAEVALAKVRLRMWPLRGGYHGFAERADTLSRGLVETAHCNRIDPLAYPEAL